jgi:transposase
MMICAIDSKRLVFVDECSTNTSLAPLYGWSRRGGRVHQKAPRNWGKNITLLASITKEEGMGPCLTVEGATTKEVFETYIEQVLAPTLGDGQVVVMDTLSSHKGERVKKLIEERGCELIYLPPYSPDFNPIEQAFSKIKNLLREARARVYEALVEAIGKALSAITPGDSQGFFEHCRYHAMGQSLWQML